MICPYCNEKAVFMTTEEYYGKDYGTNMYVCRPCDATVGTHGRTKNPKGTLANKELRQLRMEVHAIFDPLWKSGKMMRHNAYAVLQKLMNLPKEKAHIGMFNKEQCLEALEKLKAYNPPNGTDLKFKNRGHFCNYCRKVLLSKCPSYSSAVINHSIWYVWKNPELMEEFLKKIKSCKPTESAKQFHQQLREISRPYRGKPGYGTK